MATSPKANSRTRSKAATTGRRAASKVGGSRPAAKRATPRKATAAAAPRRTTAPRATGSSARKTLSASSVLPSAATLASAESLLTGLANMAPTRLTSQVKHMAEQVMDWAGTAAEMAVGATAPLVKDPRRRAALERAGEVLKDARETAGMTAQDVAAALNFSDTNMLDLAESGRIALPFEVILRLASLLARNDPIAFVMNLTRFYNPGVWKLMEQVGIGRLALNAGREREFINIYRANDNVRQLKDDEFKIVMNFTATAFNAAVELAMLAHAKRPAPKAKT